MEETDRKSHVEEGIDTHTHTHRYYPATKKDHEEHVTPTRGETGSQEHTERYVPVTKKDHDKNLEIPKAPVENVDRRYYPGGGHDE